MPLFVTIMTLVLFPLQDAALAGTSNTSQLRLHFKVSIKPDLDFLKILVIITYHRTLLLSGIRARVQLKYSLTQVQQ